MSPWSIFGGSRDKPEAQRIAKPESAIDWAARAHQRAVDRATASLSEVDPVSALFMKMERMNDALPNGS